MKSELFAIQDLSPADRHEMITLLCTQFDGVTEDSFTSDLADKNWVLLIRNAEAQIRAFSTLHIYPTCFEGRDLWVLFSGDTVVSPELWRSSSLMQAWWPAILGLQVAYGAEPLYWLLISSGYRTYRYLPALARSFHPQVGHETEPQDLRLVNWLASKRFGRNFDPATGVVTLDHPYQLRPELRDIPQERLSDPNITHFLQLNPGFADGDELVCLARITPANLTRLGQRLVDHALPYELKSAIPA